VCRLWSTSFCEMKVPSLLALDAGHGPISQSRIGFSVQGYPDRKAAGHIVSNDLNSGNRLATGPLPHGLKAFLAKRPIVQADRFEFYHLKLLIRNKKPFAAGRTAAALLSYQNSKFRAQSPLRNGIV
jgi:hypothetical protein